MMRSIKIRSVGVLAALSLASFARSQTTTLVSSPPLFFPSSNLTGWTSISRDGRFVAFSTDTRFTAIPDTNGSHDVFLRDTQTGAFERVSVGNNGEQGAWHSFGSALSDDGRYVAFYSLFSEIVPGASGAFVRDRLLGHTICINVRSDGTLVPVTSSQVSFARIAISADGRFVAFDSIADLIGDLSPSSTIRHLYVHDRDAEGDGIFDEPGWISTVRLSQSQSGAPGDHSSWYPDISPDGRFVTFHSDATNLVDRDNNDTMDVFLVDRDSDADGIFDESGESLIERVSLSDQGQEAQASSNWASVSADGRFVAFRGADEALTGDAPTSLPQIYMRDRLEGATTLVSRASDGGMLDNPAYGTELSDDGRWVTYLTRATNALVTDSNGAGADVVILDRVTGTTKRVNYTYQNQQGGSVGTDITLLNYSPAATPDGRFVAFRSNSALVPAGQALAFYLRDRGPRYLADIDGAGAVNVIDLLAVINSWGPCPAAPVPCSADLDGNGSVSVGDLLLIINNWG